MRILITSVIGSLIFFYSQGFGTSSKARASVFLKTLPNYLEIQKALAQDQLDQLSELGKKFSNTLTGLLSEDLKENEKKDIKNLSSALNQFLESKNSSEYRIQFGNISKVIVTHLKSNKEETKTLQLFFCPMFPQGYAFWVQKKPESLANPYWGKEMLTCGVKRPW